MKRWTPWLTREQMTALMESQQERCAICRKKFNPHTRPPMKDHDHMTGAIRGLICSPCNWAIGERHDKAEWFAAVSEYLTNPPAFDVIGRVFVPGSIGAAQQEGD